MTIRHAWLKFAPGYKAFVLPFVFFTCSVFQFEAELTGFLKRTFLRWTGYVA